MSTKTVTKRIALATVVALGAGVLSLVSVTSASASAANNAAAGSANVTSTAGYMNVATAASLTGAASAAAGDLSAPNTSLASTGLLAVNDITGTSTAGVTQTATLLNTGAIVLYTTTTTAGTAVTDNAVFVVTGGTISAVGTVTATPSTSTTAANAINSGNTSAAFSGAKLDSIAVKPNSGVTSFTVALYNGRGDGTTNAYSPTAPATAAQTAVANPTAGTLVGFITVTVATSSTSGTVSTAKSGVYYSDGLAGAGSHSLSGDLVLSGISWGTTSTGKLQFANIRVRDAYGVAQSGGLLQVSATNGALVSIQQASSGGATSAGSASTAFNTTYGDDTYVTVGAPSAAPVTTVVTVTYGGVVIGTKSFTFTGEVAKITLSSPVNGKTNNSTGNTATIAYADSAGNAVYLAGNTPTSGNTNDSASWGAIVTNTAVTGGTNSSTAGVLTFSCGAVAGSSSIDMKYVNQDGSVITSNALPVTCSGGAYTYTAKYDKSTYNLGDIATLTVTFKDSKGNLANDIDTPTVKVAAITTSGLGSAVTAPAVGDLPVNGVITYKFPVGNSAMATGTFANSVDFPTVDAANTAQTAQTVTLTIASSGTSLNDVLKGIVSLIASINKQIAALAKLVTKKK